MEHCFLSFIMIQMAEGITDHYACSLTSPTNCGGSKHGPCRELCLNFSFVGQLCGSAGVAFAVFRYFHSWVIPRMEIGKTYVHSRLSETKVSILYKSHCE